VPPRCCFSCAKYISAGKNTYTQVYVPWLVVYRGYVMYIVHFLGTTMICWRWSCSELGWRVAHEIYVALRCPDIYTSHLCCQRIFRARARRWKGEFSTLRTPKLFAKDLAAGQHCGAPKWQLKIKECSQKPFVFGNSNLGWLSPCAWY
jgi:hypothetical protein